MGTPARAAIYARISKTDENIPKISEQLDKCNELVETAGYDLVATFIDDGISAYKVTERDGWDDLINLVVAGDIDVLVARGQDRLSRGDMMSTATLMNLCVEAGVAFHTVQEGYSDPADTDGEFILSMRASANRWFVAKGRQNLMKSNDASRRRGEARRGGTRPFGFIVVEGRLERHDIEADLIHDAYKKFSTGEMTLTSIRTLWNSIRTDENPDGVLTPLKSRWRPQTVRQLLRRQSNIRHIVHRGEILLDEKGEPQLGDWPALIDTETWDKVQTILDGRASERSSEPKHLCSSLAHCPCGAKMRLATRNGSELSYRCATAETGADTAYEGRHTSIGTALLDELVTNEVVSAIMSMTPVDAAAGPGTDNEFVQLHATRRTIKDKIQRWNDAYEEDAITVAELKKRRVRLDSELVAVQDRLAEIAQYDARAALLNEAINQSKADLWSGPGPKNLTEAAEIRKMIRHRFTTALTLTQRRELIAEALTITVHNGRGARRVEITHKLATVLNDDTEHEGFS